jgi:uncharacterized membrane protein YciS (DUF1049 family)
MKLKIRLLLLFVIVAVGLTVNSCQKTKQDYIASLIAQNQWQLSSAQVTTYIGGTAISQLTLDTACLVTQIFKFNTDNTCSYTNFDCLAQATKGTWALSQDKLFLSVNMTCKDTIARTDTTTHSKPFETAQIINLGQYSLVLKTGDLQTNYSPTQKRVQYQWGFVRVKSQ